MIEIKKSELNGIYEFLNEIKLNKITSPDVRRTILKLVVHIPKAIEDVQKSINEIRNRFFEEFAKEDLAEFQNSLNLITDLLRSGNFEEASLRDKETTGKYPEIVVAYKNFNDSLLELQNETVSFEIDPMDMSDFIDGLSNQDVDVTAKELTLLKSILY